MKQRLQTITSAIIIMLLLSGGAWAQSGNWEDYANNAVENTDYSKSGSTFNVYTALGLAKAAKLVNNGTYININIKANIDLSAHYWTPCGSISPDFDGTFNGENHSISGIYINLPTTTYVGLIGYASNVAMVKNVTVVNPTIQGSRYVGGVVGYNHGYIDNCHINGGTITGDRVTNRNSNNNSDRAGGIAGYNKRTITNCTATNAHIVTYFKDAGGIVGNNDGTITSCTTTSCSIDCGDTAGGGIAGWTSTSSTVTNCSVVSTNVIDSHPNNMNCLGAIIGENVPGTVSENTYTVDCTVTIGTTQYQYGKGTAGSGLDGIGIGSKTTGAFYPDVAGKYEAETVKTWAKLKAAMANGGNILLGANITDPSHNSESYLEVPSGKTVTLDLNGYTIDRGLASSAAISSGFVIKNEGTLTIQDNSTGKTGVITGGKNASYGGAIYNTGTLNFQSGTISGNYGGWGGGIFIDGGTVNMSGGAISNNSADSHGGICVSGGTLNLTGGVITANNAGGIYMASKTTLKMSGSPTVTGNTDGTKANNIMLYSSTVINITGALTNTTPIGITKSSPYTGVFTSGLSGNGDASNFVSDNSTYVVSLTAGGEAQLVYPTVVLTINNDGGDGYYYSTYYYSDTNRQADENTEVYIGALNDEKTELNLTPVSDRIIKKGEGVILKRATSGDATLTPISTNSATNYKSNILKGVNVSTATSSISGTVYVLSKVDDKVGFYRYTGTNLGAHKAYLSIANSSAPGFTFSYGDNETTGIEGPSPDPSLLNGGEWYTLDGRKLDGKPTAKGLYIVNGKKVVVK